MSAPGGESAWVTRPVAPADLDTRLVQHYPLRGLVLDESGFARVRFTVAASGAVTAGEVVKASEPAYATACAQMLRASTWQPARDVAQRPVGFTGTFDCVFEHSAQPEEFAPRTSLGDAAMPPVPPKYDDDWYQRFADDYLARDAGARLSIAVAPDGRVQVLGSAPGGDPTVADACRKLLEDGPAWQPARNAKNEPVRFEGSFDCRVHLESKRKELALGDVGAKGPLPVDGLAAVFKEHLPVFSHCFESALGMSKPVHGRHWLALEILATGVIGRVQWIERPLEDEVLEQCVFSAVRTLSFAAAPSSTLADVQLELGGISGIEFQL